MSSGLTIGIFGGTGFLGSQLALFFRQRGHRVLIMTRKPLKDDAFHVYWNPYCCDGWEGVCRQLDVIINLTGAPITDRLWTKKRKAILYDSRIMTTQTLVKAVQGCDKPPRVWIQASAIGIYPAQDQVAQQGWRESDAPGHGFLSRLCVDWEAAVQPLSRAQTRVCVVRLAPILGCGGIMQKLALPFQWGLGHVMGSGKAPFSWLHEYDFCQLVDRLIADDRFDGPVNAVASQVVTFHAFAKALATHYHRPCALRVPARVVRTVLGDMATVFLEGQQVYPEKLMTHIFGYRYTTVVEAIKACQT